MGLGQGRFARFRARPVPVPDDDLPPGRVHRRRRRTRARGKLDPNLRPLDPRAARAATISPVTLAAQARLDLRSLLRRGTALRHRLRRVPVYFRVHGVSLRDIGLMSLLSLPWTWKMLWRRSSTAMAPGSTGSRLPRGARRGDPRHCVAGPVAAHLGAVACCCCSPPHRPPRTSPSTPTRSTWRRRRTPAALTEPASPRPRRAARRGGGMIFLAEFTEWKVLWVLLAGAFVALAVAGWASPRVRLDEAARRHALAPVLRWLLRWQMLPVILFVPLYKLGDSTLGRMVKPFWVDRGYSLAEIGSISVTLGVVLTILGAWPAAGSPTVLGSFAPCSGWGSRSSPRTSATLPSPPSSCRAPASTSHRCSSPSPRAWHRGVPVIPDEPLRPRARGHPVRDPVGPVCRHPRRRRRVHRDRVEASATPPSSR